MTIQMWRQAAAMAALVCASVIPAGAQQPEVATQTIPGWTFTPGVVVGAVYDNNVSLSDAPASTGQTPSDKLFMLQPSGRLEFHGPRTVFSSGYRGFFRRYVELDQLNSFEQRADLSVRRLASERLTVYLTNSFANVPTTDDVELEGVTFSRTGTSTNSLAAGFSSRLTQFMDLAVRYDNTWVSFDRLESTDTFLADGVLNGVRTELSRRVTPRLSFGGEYAIRVASLNEGTRSLLFQDAGGTLNYALSPRTSFSAGAGLSYLADRTFDDTRTGPYFRAGVTHEFPRATVGASFQRSFVPSFGFGGASESQELSGFARMPLHLNRVYIEGSGSWRRSEPLIETSLELDTIRLRAALGYSARRWLRGETYYTYARQDSVVTGGEIDRHRVGLQFVISQPMRIR